MNHWQQINYNLQPFENQKIAIDNAVTGLAEVGFHGLLQEMGLGKTKCALSTSQIMAKYGVLKRILILCPKSIIGVWVEEIPKHSHFSFTPLVWDSQKAKTKKFAYRVNEVMTGRFPILIINIEAFQSANKNMEMMITEYLKEPSIVILDESSKIKSMKAQRTERILEYTKDARYKLILTGTEVEESPLDVFAQFEFLKPGFWYKTPDWTAKKAKRNFYMFTQKYAIMQETRMGEGRSFKQIVGYRKIEEIAHKIAPYITRQKKKDWMDLPEKLFQVLPVEMGKDQARVYNDLKKSLIAEYGGEIITAANAGALLTRLRQVAGGFIPETGEMVSGEGIKAILDDVEEYNGKVVISCAYVAEIKGIEKALINEYGPENVVTFYGETKNRDEVIARFRDRAKFLVGNATVLSYGLNLQSCSLMYNYSRSFSYAINAQLEDRIHRPGQKEMCIYKDVIHTGTVQEKVRSAFEKKQDFVNSFQRMTLKELLN